MTGRCYYYNRGSQERTWKPPRWTRDASINKGDSQSHADHEVVPSEITSNEIVMHMTAVLLWNFILMSFEVSRSVIFCLFGHLS